VFLNDDDDRSGPTFTFRFALPDLFACNLCLFYSTQAFIPTSTPITSECPTIHRTSTWPRSIITSSVHCSNFFHPTFLRRQVPTHTPCLSLRLSLLLLQSTSQSVSSISSCFFRQQRKLASNHLSAISSQARTHTFLRGIIYVSIPLTDIYLAQKKKDLVRGRKSKRHSQQKRFAEQFTLSYRTSTSTPLKTTKIAFFFCQRTQEVVPLISSLPCPALPCEAQRHCSHAMRRRAYTHQDIHTPAQ